MNTEITIRARVQSNAGSEFLDQLMVAQHLTQYFDKFSYHVGGTTIYFHDVAVTLGENLGPWWPNSRLPDKGKEIVGITNHGEAYIHPSSTVKPFRPGVTTTHWCYAPEPEDPDGFKDWHQKWMPVHTEASARLA